MPVGEDLAEEPGCTLLVFGTPASGKSSLISALTRTWLAMPGELEISIIADNGLLESSDFAPVVAPFGTESEIRLSPKLRRSVAAITSRDVVAASVPGQIAVLELATFDWQAVRENLDLPDGRRSYGIFLSCRRDVSVRRQHDRVLTGAFNAVLPGDVMDLFLATEPPRQWLASQLDRYWEFDTSDTSVDELLAAVLELSRYGARRVRHLYDSRDATRAARESLEQAAIGQAPRSRQAS